MQIDNRLKEHIYTQQNMNVKQKHKHVNLVDEKQRKRNSSKEVNIATETAANKEQIGACIYTICMEKAKRSSKAKKQHNRGKMGGI